ncbi:MAG: tRNA (N(6)-L-threonylcarbamoyladenosine(37)-C(2))-methylthiotransferase MtaB [Bacilli bacterium]|nr:tRNA (N(6)-L-threonylcarbamoyladenosine(37)-C(2))-methylthiotransferase MtaB [Bacilli bacterium]MDD4607862.1 tRNA (N(6)-L-threonylcarbamoyladenosine(37)-C(2))-methylthiotransferase MtaB [Bacilli bacterium]
MKFYIYTLGCKVNTYESNVIHDILINNGYKEDHNADIYIVNSCTVTNTAANKTVKLVKRLRKDKQAIIIVVGCLCQDNSELLKEYADIIIGNNYKSKIIDYINSYKETGKQIIEVHDLDDAPFEDMSLNNFNKTRAFVKIEDGCDNYCSYCIIPYTRGTVRSKGKSNTISEVKSLIANGHKEIVLTGIHTGHYRDGDYQFSDLLNDLVKIEGLERLRISSIEITELDDKVLDVIKNSKVIVDHLHIPLQSGSDSILVAMNRKYNINYFIDKIEKIRNLRPDISITTDVIVGFPGETEENFKETIENIKKINFTKLHVFPYSIRKGTVAATLPNQIDIRIKKERVKTLLELSRTLELNYMNKFINREVTFIPEIIKDGYLIGHTGNYLLIKAKGSEELINNLVKVNIKEIDYPHCTGVLNS